MCEMIKKGSSPPFIGQEFHDAHMGHGGIDGHCCPDHDDLFICRDCIEFATCGCFDPKPLACAPIGAPTDPVAASQGMLFAV